jgi:Nicotinamide phosphoribosyltransferase, N-terminal domain
MSGPLGIPIALLTDSYKTSHFKLYPDALKMVAYGEFRAGYDKDTTDTRCVFYGIRYIIENYVHVKHTLQDVELASAFFETHNAGGTTFPFPKDLFIKVVPSHSVHFRKRRVLSSQDPGVARGKCRVSACAWYIRLISLPNHRREGVRTASHVARDCTYHGLVPIDCGDAVAQMQDDY